MLANIVRQSVGNTTPNADGSWNNTSCWEFNGTNSISAVVAEALPLPSEDELTIAFWFKIVHMNSVANNDNNVDPFPVAFLGTQSGALVRMTGSYAKEQSGGRIYLRVPRDNTQILNHTVSSTIVHPSSGQNHIGQWFHIAMTYNVDGNFFKLFRSLGSGSTSGSSIAADFGLPATVGTPFYLKIGGSYNALGQGTGGGSYNYASGAYAANNYYHAVGHCFLDSPNTTSEITYKLYFRGSSGSYTYYINRRASDDLFRGSTSLICTEISG